ncbi:Ig-like domain-containing protein [Butyrivibrio sp. WCD3002]|uniref:Ig-like domain-containing protein n=1 Tax=Butyrivibrio sp. WCD3002 TaxID=1280676 RepID=UPI0003FB1D8B|nr:Ig-like domain-containing protein [Butyrivibrio sp. WCD3002]
MKKSAKRRKTLITLITTVVVILTTIVPSGFSIRAKAANSKREKAAAIAYGEIGNTDRTKYGAKPDYDWCAYFASWCAHQAGLDDSQWLFSGSTNILVAFFESKGRWHNKTTNTWYFENAGWVSIGTGIVDDYMPQKGDFVAIENDTKDPEPGHTGIVYDVDVAAGKLYTIEGNTGQQYPRRVLQREYWLSSLRRVDAGSYIVGFGEPDYGPDDDLGPKGYNIGTSMTEVYDSDIFTLTCIPDKSDITSYTLVVNGRGVDVTDLMKAGNGSSDFTLRGNDDGIYEIGFCVSNNYGSFTGTKENGGVLSITKKSISWGTPANLGEQFTGWIVNNYGGRVAVQSTDVVCKKASGAKNEYWTFYRQSDGSYLIKSLNNGKYLVDKADKNGAGATIATSSTVDDYAKWFIYDKGNNNYVFRNGMFNAGVLDLHNGGTADGDPYHLMTYSDHFAQKFDILKRVPLNSVSLNKTSLSLKEGESSKVTRNLNPSSSNDIYESFNWKSSNEKVATVSGSLEEATIKAAGAGTATITYTVTTKLGQTFSDTMAVTVQKKTVDVTDISLNEKSLELKTGDKKKLFATIYPSNATEKGIIWSSNNSSVAVVDNDGNVEAKGVGTAIITATSKANSNIKATCSVEVSYPTIDKPVIAIVENSVGSIKVGQEVYYDSFVLNINFSDSSVVWSSSDESIFTVDQTGKVTGKKAGEAVLKLAFVAEPSIYDTVTVKVVGNDDGGGSSSGGSDEPGTGGGNDEGDKPGTGGGSDEGDKPGTGGGSGSENQQNPDVNSNNDKGNNSSNKQPSVDSSNTAYLEKGTEIIYQNAKYVVSDTGKVTFVELISKKKTSATVPDAITVDGIQYEVTAIADNAFKNNTKLKKIKIGSNITVIGKNAFSGCKNLKSVTIPAKVEIIGAKAFYKCKSLSSVKIKSKIISSIGKNAFSKIGKNAKISVPKDKRKDYKNPLKKAGYVLK